MILSFSDTRVDRMRSLEDMSALSLKHYIPPWATDYSPAWTFIDTRDFIVGKRRNIHGFYRLSEGYSLAFVPKDARVVPTTGRLDVPDSCTISNNYSLPKAVVAIVQLLFASFILARNAQTEIEYNGYGAHSLTVIPYALMSCINLLGLTVNPSYPTLYMVRSEIMDEATSRGSRFDGVVGQLIAYDAELAPDGLNKVAGIFTYEEVTTRRRPEISVSSNNWGYVANDAATTPPALAGALKTREHLIFTPDYLLSAESVGQPGIMLPASNLGQHNCPPASRATSPGAEYMPRSHLVNRSSPTDLEKASLFIPACPAFKMTDRRKVYYADLHCVGLLRYSKCAYIFKDTSSRMPSLGG